MREGSLSPASRDRTNEKVPAPMPLIITIVIGSFDDMFLVKLLSAPHNMQARSTNSAPTEKPNFPDASNARTRHANVSNKRAATTCLPICSRKNMTARNVVAAASKFSSIDAVAAGVPDNPYMSAAGARIPPEMTAPNSHGKSDLRKFRLPDPP